MKANLRLALSPLAFVLLAGCVAPAKAPPPVAAPAPPPAPVQHAPIPAPLPEPPRDWRDAPATPGEWRWSMEGRRSIARFSQPGQPPIAWLICDQAAKRVLLGHSGAGDTHIPMAVATTTGRRPLLSEPLASAPGEVDAVLRPDDPVLDAIAFTRGRFLLEVQGQPPLYLPSWPELSRVIEDCR